MGGVRRKIAGIAMCIMLVNVNILSSALAEEFGNILVPSVDDLSREASAEALGAAALVLRGFQRRELKQKELSQQDFKSAGISFKSSYSKMQEILKRQENDPELRRFLSESVSLDIVSDNEQSNIKLKAMLIKLGTKSTDSITKKEAFDIFTKQTKNMAVLFNQEFPDLPLKIIIRPKSNNSYYSYVINELSDYLFLGGQLAEIMKLKKA